MGALVGSDSRDEAGAGHQAAEDAQGRGVGCVI